MIKTSNKNHFNDRELAWLAFNERVLQQAEDLRLPLLERLKFLAIYQSNLDEFYMKRISVIRARALKRQDSNEISRLEQIYTLCRQHYDRAFETYKQDIKPSLAKNGLKITSWEDLSSSEKKKITSYFKQNILPVLTPITVDQGHPFPHISSLSLSLALKLEKHTGGEPFFARVKIPKIFPVFLEVQRKGNQKSFVSILGVIRHHISMLFNGSKVLSTLAFRITRNIEFERDEEEAEDLLQMIADELKERRFGHTVKMECESDSDPWLLDILKAELQIHGQDIYQNHGPLDYSDFNQIAQSGSSRLKFRNWSGLVPKEFQKSNSNSLFSTLRRRDILLHHPYESYKHTTEELIKTAASDPKVLGIKVSLYRTDKDSRLIQALIEAIENGKEVVCVIELKARLDEANNIGWATTLEQAGAHIIYGMVGLKTHCKLILITRKEPRGLKCYTHIGTGNYNATTSGVYTDLGLLTSKSSITSEVVEVFHYLTGKAEPAGFKELLVAPFNLREQLTDLISTEISNHKNKKPSGIKFKLNNLEDRKIASKIIEAAKSGVHVELYVRGICVIKPTKNLVIKSVVDQFLEHSRILYFRSGESQERYGKVYIGSADLMTRNLDRRVEVHAPIQSIKLKTQILNIFECIKTDNTQSWVMNNDGAYSRTVLGSDEKPINFQASLKKYYQKKHKRS